MESTGLVEPLKAAIEESGLTSYALGKEAGVPPISIDRFKSGKRGLSLETADKLARVLQLVVTKPPKVTKPQWQDTGRDPACWVLKIVNKVVAEVQRDDNGEWRWQRTTTLAEHGLPPASGRTTSRREAQKKAWPK